MKLNIKNLRPGDLITFTSGKRLVGHPCRVRSVAQNLIFVDWMGSITGSWFSEGSAIDAVLGAPIRINKNAFNFIKTDDKGNAVVTCAVESIKDRLVRVSKATANMVAATNALTSQVNQN